MKDNWSVVIEPASEATVMRYGCEIPEYFHIHNDRLGGRLYGTDTPDENSCRKWLGRFLTPTEIDTIINNAIKEN